ncbi:MAG TPA: DUF4252 domain-containing protein [Flavobacteriaceae bacterium]|jgi:hypothetical protein|nr:DNA topoisomerase IV [Flavobacteriaceae bacterium]MAM29198.1 DNA topoisomerase IV [Flavobacteriaceae bacterium]MAY51683.1 DNA topoisomerase IV [Flavobacteriaceae bacterium]HIB48270.1 DUF4252 domain-containing protein [Flavobacteriaceae bacterium]HIN97715.1 DUF4252 domain-containing protein [Flavobacteriaceae bacterium]|tara:strand:- start:166577 stop:167113 length:537 start_codon:yes stop_codon:yes gene_type:complete
MKKLAIILAFLMAPILAQAQNPFAGFENEDDVTSFVATKKMFKLMSKMDFDSSDPEVKEYLELVNNLDNVRILTTDNPGIAARMNDAVTSYVSSNGALSELMRVKDDGKNVKFYSKEGKNDNFVTELLMHLTGNIDGKERTVVMSITGNIDLKKVSKLTKDLNVPGSEELKNIDKKKQ